VVNIFNKTIASKQDYNAQNPSGKIIMADKGKFAKKGGFFAGEAEKDRKTIMTN
jgi:hypothetical protein